LIERPKEMTMRTKFPYHKQPLGSVYCGYYRYEHMRVQERYTTGSECVRGYTLLGIDAYLYIVFDYN